MFGRSRRSRRRWGAALLAGVVAVALVSCGGDSGGDSAGAGGGEPQRGGTLRVLEGTEYPSLDPVKALPIASGAPLNVLHAVFGSLVYSEAPSGDVEMGLAESLTTSDSGRTWLLKLREGITFSDGEPFDADAVTYNWDRINDPANGSPALATMARFESYEVQDPLTVKVVLRAPDAQFPRLIAGAFSHIGSPAAIESAGDDFGSAPVGAGAFKVQEWVRNDHLTLVRNDSFWDAPRPYLDEVVFRWNPDESGQMLRSFQAREADVMFVRSDFQVAGEAEDGGANVVRIAAAAGSGLFMNQQVAALGDERVREAFGLALDRTAIASTIYGEDAPPAGMFNEDSPFYDAGNDYPAHDLDRAQDLIDDYVADTGGEIDLTYTYSAGYATQQNLAQVIEQQLEELDGVQIELNPLQTAALIQQNRDGDTEVGLLAIQGVWPDPALYNQFHTDGQQNNIGYSSEATDAALDRAHTAESVDEQAGAYQEVAASILDDMAYVPLHASVYGIVSQPDVQNVKGFTDSGLLLDQVWLDG